MRPFGRGVAADNPHVTTVESEILTPAGRRWVERVQRPLDVLAVIFLIDVILIWSFPDAPPAFLQTLNVIVLFVWACFAVDYVARLMLSVAKGQVRSDTQVGPAHGPAADAAVAARRPAPAS